VKSNAPLTENTRALESLIRRRVSLFFFKRPKSDFIPNVDEWGVRAILGNDQQFVFEVSRIVKIMELFGVSKSKNCTSFVSKDTKRPFCMYVTSDPLDHYEIASELCSAWLRATSLHNNLLWSTILQSSDEVLRDQGFPIQRTYYDAKTNISLSQQPSSIPTRPPLGNENQSEKNSIPSKEVPSVQTPKELPTPMAQKPATPNPIPAVPETSNSATPNPKPPSTEALNSKQPTQETQNLESPEKADSTPQTDLPNLRETVEKNRKNENGAGWSSFLKPLSSIFSHPEHPITQPKAPTTPSRGQNPPSQGVSNPTPEAPKGNSTSLFVDRKSRLRALNSGVHVCFS
jgi:hypothetical protein